MRIYLIDRATGEVKQEFNNVINWRSSFVEYMTGKFRTKRYCDFNTEYFSSVVTTTDGNAENLNAELEEKRQIN